MGSCAQGPSTLRVAAAPQPSAHPCSYAGKNLGSRVRGGGDRRKGTEMRPACYDRSRMWPRVFISFLPPRDDSGHCLCAQSGQRPTFPPLCHFILTPTLEGWRRARPVLSGARLLSVCVGGTLATSAGDPEEGGSPLGRGICLPSSWTLTVTLLLNPGGPRALDAPDSPAPCERLSRCCGLPSGKPLCCFSKPGLTRPRPLPRLPRCRPQRLSLHSHFL